MAKINWLVITVLVIAALVIVQNQDINSPQKQFVWGWPIVTGLAAVAVSIVTNIFALLKPSPSIPIWVWIIGFMLLFFIIKKK